MPRHAGGFQHGNRFTHEIVHILEVSDARVVVVLAWKKGEREVRRVYVGEWVILGVPTSEANIKAANTRAMIIDNNDFFVVRPKLHIIYQN